MGFLKNNFGGDLLSHTVTRAVPSALKDLTSVFGMGTGVPPPVIPPKTVNLFISKADIRLFDYFSNKLPDLLLRPGNINTEYCS